MDTRTALLHRLWTYSDGIILTHLIFCRSPFPMGFNDVLLPLFTILLLKDPSLNLLFLPSLHFPLFLHSFPLLGIESSISFKAHVKGTVCCFQRLLCPAFLPPNLVSLKHFPIPLLSRPLFSQALFSSHLSFSHALSFPNHIFPGKIMIRLFVKHTTYCVYNFKDRDLKLTTKKKKSSF